MNNRLIKVNKKEKNILIKGGTFLKQNYYNNANMKYKRYKSNNKIYKHKKENKLLNHNNLNNYKKSLSVDIFSVKRNIKKNNIKEEPKKILPQNKNSGNKPNKNKSHKNNGTKQIKLNKSHEKIKLKKNAYKSINTLNDKTNLVLNNEKMIPNNLNKINKTINKMNSINIIKNDLKEIEKQFNNINKINDLILKELNIINQNKEINNQNELKIKEIINNVKEKNQLKKNLLDDYINKEKIQNKNITNCISMNEEKISKLKEIKKDIENYNKIITDFVLFSKNNNALNDNNKSILDTRNVLLKLKEKIQKYFQLSKEIQNNQKFIYNNLINEISYLKNSILLFINNKEKEKNDSVKNDNIKKEKIIVISLMIK